jgi:hypothetical protein
MEIENVTATYPLLRLLGKGPGFAGFAYFVGAGLMLLTYLKVDVAPLALPLGVLCAGYYGGGGWKAAAEAKNGSAKGVA